jgi:hypothetical protein
MEGFIKEVFQVRDQGKPGRKALIGYLKKEFGVEISTETAARFLRYPNLKKILTGIMTIQESVFLSKIVGDQEPLQGKRTIQVIFPDPIGKDIFFVDEITTLEQARLGLRQKVRQLFWQVDPDILNPLIQISLAMLQPNLRYDQEENDKSLAVIMQRYPSTIIAYKPGDILVPFHKVIDNKDALLLAASHEAGKEDLYGRLPWVLFVICFSVLLYNLLLPKIFSLSWRMEPPYQLFLIVLTLTILVCKACLLFTPYPVYLLPFTILPLLLVLLLQERISITLPPC